MKEEQIRRTPYFTPYSSSASSQGYCNICYNRFDEEDFKPLLICDQNHCVCRACLRLIHKKPKCPFCRGTINLNYIRLNKEVLQRISKQKKGQHQKKNYIKTVQNQRLNTEGTVNDQERGEQLVDPQQLVDELEDDSEQAISAQREEILLKILIAIELFFLQFPFGLYSLITAINAQDQSVPDALRNTMFTLGYVELQISAILIYFSAMQCSFLLSESAINCYYFCLILGTLVKSIIAQLAYNSMLWNGQLIDCSRLIIKYVFMSMIANYLQLALGFFLAVKYIYRLRRE